MSCEMTTIILLSFCAVGNLWQEVGDLILPKLSKSGEIAYVCADSVLERVPGLSKFLAWIDERGLKKAAVTNAPRENARVMLAALGLGCAHTFHPSAFGKYRFLREAPVHMH